MPIAIPPREMRRVLRDLMAPAARDRNPAAVERDWPAGLDIVMLTVARQSRDELEHLLEELNAPAAHCGGLFEGLSPAQRWILGQMLRWQGGHVSRGDLMAAAPHGLRLSATSIYGHVRAIRACLRAADAPYRIETSPGIGWQLQAIHPTRSATRIAA